MRCRHRRDNGEGQDSKKGDDAAEHKCKNRRSTRNCPLSPLSQVEFRLNDVVIDAADTRLPGG
jgi:hypothetical protein